MLTLLDMCMYTYDKLAISQDNLPLIQIEWKLVSL